MAGCPHDAQEFLGEGDDIAAQGPDQEVGQAGLLGQGRGGSAEAEAYTLASYYPL